MRNLNFRITFLLLSFAVVLFNGACARSHSDTAAASQLSHDDPAIKRAEDLIAATPDSPAGYTALAASLMKASRKSGEFSLNMEARNAVRRALEISPTDVSARKLAALLHLSYHEFSEALEAAETLRSETPSDPFLFGILSDAYLELGHYDKAIESTQRMVDLKPNAASYSRVAQLRSLHGDHEGAVEMFTKAARVADPGDKETQSWCLVQLGDEFWKHGKYADAERTYDEALLNYPDYFLARVAKGRVRASVGDLPGAERALIEAQSKVPDANATLLLADLYTVLGDGARASQRYEQYDRMQAELGDAADHKRLCLSWADRGKIEEALALASHEYSVEKSINSADLLAWTLYRAGRASEAQQYIREAMRLNTKDARTLYHAGMIAKALGKNIEARQLLSTALATNPAFDLLGAIEAKNALTVLK